MFSALVPVPELPLFFSFMLFRGYGYNWATWTCCSNPLQQGRELSPVPARAELCLVFLGS